MKSPFSPIKFSVLRLLLLSVSAIAIAFLPKNEFKKTFNGNLNVTNTPMNFFGQWTCEGYVSGSPACTYTATNGFLSSTTTAGKGILSSDLTQPFLFKVKTDTGFGGLNSSQSPI